LQGIAWPEQGIGSQSSASFDPQRAKMHVGLSGGERRDLHLDE